MPDHDVVIVAARRTPIATRSRAFASLRTEELAGPVIRCALADAEAATGSTLPIADVILGNCMGPGGNPARIAALAAGLGIGVPGATIDRQCGSGLAAVIDAARAIGAGDERPRIAGGVESASTAPARSLDGTSYPRAPFAPAGWPDPDMVEAAENLAQAEGITRERQDAHARRSHERARQAQDTGRFAAEIVVINETTSDDAIGVGERVLDRARPLFPSGTVTAATSTRVSDGAAAVILVPAQVRGTAPGLVIRAHAIVGCNPALPGIGAAPAVQTAFASGCAKIGDVAAFEIVEAFAAQSLAVLGQLGIEDDDPRVSADGGALALGHPWGASGAVALVRLFSRLVRAGAPAGTLGVAAASVGGGLGVAMLVEVVR
ncbi:thiolase family protein [Kineosporia babensis]|uniref:Thiolase family protein n=1 Tax=Kineosporia babensis TaxID=499548 RepID=A0A9X1SWN2_9ACTN|nr:thiolase family protein [Kineosporia babensis]MCD5314981.1 thiolase family protein [Kineosporia babensis]